MSMRERRIVHPLTSLPKRQKHVGMFADRFVGGVAEQLLGTFVPSGNQSTQAFAEDSLVGTFHNRGQMRETALGALALRKIAHEGVKRRRPAPFHSRKTQF